MGLETLTLGLTLGGGVVGLVIDRLPSPFLPLFSIILYRLLPSLLFRMVINFDVYGYSPFDWVCLGMKDP